MARSKSEDKRSAILQSSKTLFAKQGFFNTSISDIVKDTGLPAGSIYTYFENKEEIVRIIVDEGWADMYNRLQQTISDNSTPETKLKALIEQFIPELTTDLDLINILLTEAIEFTRIEEKAEKLATMILSIIKPLSQNSKTFSEFNRKTMKAAMIVYFLGILNSLKIARSSSIGVDIKDIIDFIKLTIQNSMGIKI